MIPWSFLLKPKVLAGIGSFILVIAIGLFIRGAIHNYGEARYNQGKADCETAVRKKAAETKTKLDTAKDAARGEADKTEKVYVEVVKDVAVVDARVAAENAALKNTLETLEARISNEKPDLSACAREPIPADSLSVHNEIDRLLRSD